MSSRENVSNALVVPPLAAKPAGKVVEAKEKELPAITAAYDLAKWMLDRASKMPRHLRGGLGRRMEDRTQEVLELLLNAKYDRDKAPYLREANRKLETFRFLTRLARDADNCFTETMYLAAAQLTVKVGSQVGLWLKNVEKRPGI